MKIEENIRFYKKKGAGTWSTPFCSGKYAIQ